MGHEQSKSKGNVPASHDINHDAPNQDKNSENHLTNQSYKDACEPLVQSSSEKKVICKNVADRDGLPEESLPTTSCFNTTQVYNDHITPSVHEESQNYSQKQQVPKKPVTQSSISTATPIGYESDSVVNGVLVDDRDVVCDGSDNVITGDNDYVIVDNKDDDDSDVDEGDVDGEHDVNVDNESDDFRDVDETCNDVSVGSGSVDVVDENTNNGDKNCVANEVLVNIILPAAVDWKIVNCDLKRVQHFPKFKLLTDLRLDGHHKTDFCVSFRTKKQARFAMHLLQTRKKKVKAVYCEKLIQSCQEQIVKDKDDILATHNVKAQEIAQKIMSLQTGSKRKKKKTNYVKFDDFEKNEAIKETLTQTAIEINGQSQEFVALTNCLVQRLEHLRGVSHKDITADIKEIKLRFEREKVRMTNSLPIYAKKTTITQTIMENQVSIVLGETGSGKSTQLVQYLLDAGFAEEEKIICTQPRKVAAFSLAKRVSEELMNDKLVDCMSGSMATKTSSKIYFTTDHSLLMKCLKDRTLSRYSCIVIDEAHERNIDTDLLLGIIKKALPLRPDLRVVVTSATIDPKLFQDYFGGCHVPVLRVSGRVFPVDVEFKSNQYGDDYVSEAVNKAVDIHKSKEPGDVLIFLTSPSEIDRACSMLPKQVNTRDIICLPLHGKLQQEDQKKVFIQTPQGKRKMVFSTNCAETSLTIPGIKFVIDSGRAKEMKYDQKRNLSSLEVAIISQSSANQRKGRAGRTDSGKCYRLYTEEQFNSMEKASRPEILRVHLGQAMLKLMELGIENPEDFDYVESPPVDSIKAAIEELKELGAIEDGRLSELGKKLARIPLEPRLGKFLFEGLSADVGYEALVLVSIATINGSVFFRVGTEEEKRTADGKKFEFCQYGGDLMTLLEVFRKWLEVDERDRGRWCFAKSLNGKALRMANETVKELKMILNKDLNIRNIQWAKFDRQETDRIIQRILFSCFLCKLCVFTGHEKYGYQTVVGNHFVKVHPSSAVRFMGDFPTLVVYEKILKTSQDYIINVTPVEEHWLLKIITNPSMIEKTQWLINNMMVQQTPTHLSKVLADAILSPLKEKMPMLKSYVSESCDNLPVVLDLRKGDDVTLEIFVSPLFSDQAKQAVQRFLEKGRVTLREKTCEYPVEGAPGLKVIMESGLTLQGILFQESYRSIFSPQADSALHDYLNSKGRIIDFHVSKKNQTFATYQRSEDAVSAVKEARDFKFCVYPKSDKNQKDGGRFTVFVKWLRREPKGMANVTFDDPVPWNDLDCSRWSRNAVVGSKNVRITEDKYKPKSLFLSNLLPSTTKIQIKDAVEQVFPDSSVSESSISIQYKQRQLTHDVSTEVQRRILEQLIEPFATPGCFSVAVQQCQPQQVWANATVWFENTNEGMEAAKRLKNLPSDGLEKWTVELTITPKLDFYHACPKQVFDAVKDEIFLELESIISEECKEKCGNSLLLNVENLGKAPASSPQARVKLQVETNCIEHYIMASKAITRAIQGEKFDCEKSPKGKILLTSATNERLESIQNETGVLICRDVRTSSLVVYGLRLNRQRALHAIESYVFKMVISDTSVWKIQFKGTNKPRGLLKVILERFGSNLEKICEIEGVIKVEKCIFKHVLTIQSTAEAKETILRLFEEIERSLPCQNELNQTTKDYKEECPICICEVEDVYRISACGHAYCKGCVLEQLKASTFPMKCAVDTCEEMFNVSDLEILLGKQTTLSKEVAQKSLKEYLTTHSDHIKHCPSPDCPMIYRVTTESLQFRCNVCDTATCTSCHKPYHLGMTCKEFEIDSKDQGRIELEKWMGKNSKERKRCPTCKRPIERFAGCNYMQCPPCKNHFCWVCLKDFKSSDEVYDHQRSCPGQQNRCKYRLCNYNSANYSLFIS